MTIDEALAEMKHLKSDQYFEFFYREDRKADAEVVRQHAVARGYDTQTFREPPINAWVLRVTKPEGDTMNTVLEARSVKRSIPAE
jgi:hypothetical protein